MKYDGITHIKLNHCCKITKGYWIRNNQNGGWKWNGNLFNINKIPYSLAMWEYPLLAVNYLVSILLPLTILSNMFIRIGTYTLMFIGMLNNNIYHPTSGVLNVYLTYLE